MLDLNNYEFLYNAEAHFAAMEMFPDGFFQTMLRDDKKGYDALCWGLAELSQQAELVRRYKGLDSKEYLTEEYVRAMLDYNQTPEALRILVGAVSKGLNVQQDENEEIDEVLAEIQKKRAKTNLTEQDT